MRKILAIAALAACSSESTRVFPTPGAWTAGQSIATPREVTVRGFLDRRGLLHAHSIHSHDACDGKPRDESGHYDQTCLAQFRKAICDTKLDYVFLTDHRESFAENEFPDTMLYDASQGDLLVDHGAGPTGNRIRCESGASVLVMAGSESGTMPVGLETHVAGSVAERGAKYDRTTPEAIEDLKAHGAVAMVAHTEDWSVDQLSTLPIDGFEMYNLHANAFVGAGALLQLIGGLGKDDVKLPQPDLFFVPILSEDDRYLSKWGSTLARGIHRVTSMGTDCHRNSFPQITSDGDRIDSYRRTMGWFSNHLLVRGEMDDRSLKEALRSERLYGSFDVFGIPEGFDFHGDGAVEMGSTAPLGSSLHVTLPTLAHLDPQSEPPVVSARILRAREGGWDEVARKDGPIDIPIAEKGAYRAEIRITPKHLRPSLGDWAHLADRESPWVYSNAIYFE